MQFNKSESTGFVVFLFTWLTALGSAFAAAAGSFPSSVTVVYTLITAGVAGVSAYAVSAGIALPAA